MLQGYKRIGFWLKSGLNKRLRLYVSSLSIKIGTRLKTSTSWGYKSFDFWLSSGLNKKRLRLYVSSLSIKIGTRLKTSTSWG